MDKRPVPSKSSTAESKSAQNPPMKTAAGVVSRKVFWTVLISTLALLFVSLGALIASFPAVDFAEAQKMQAQSELDKQDAREAAVRAAKRAADAEKTRIANEVNRFAAIGLQPAGNGLYYRWATSDEFSCGYWACAAVYVATGGKGCSSVYLEANITSGGMAIGIANATVGALGPNSSAGMMLDDYVGGDGFSITKINCW